MVFTIPSVPASFSLTLLLLLVGGHRSLVSVLCPPLPAQVLTVFLARYGKFADVLSWPLTWSNSGVGTILRRRNGRHHLPCPYLSLRSGVGGGA